MTGWLNPDARTHLRNRRSGPIGPHVITYTTTGGTYIVATEGLWPVKRRNDIAIILRDAHGADTVTPLWARAHPDLIAELDVVLNGTSTVTLTPRGVAALTQPEPA